MVEPGENEVNLKHLILYSGALEFWEMFEIIYLTSPLDAQGYFTVMSADAYLSGKTITNMSHFEFWDAVNYCLYRLNHKLYLQRMRKQGQHGR